MIWQDQAKLNMKMVQNAFWDYVAKATETTEDILQNIKESEIGQEIKWAINNKNLHYFINKLLQKHHSIHPIISR